jgi:hypothetical protein
MDFPPFVLFLLLIAALLVSRYIRYRKRLAFINTYKWPPGLTAKLRRSFPNLSIAEEEKIASGLKQFFRAYLKCWRNPVVMPSKAAGELWREFTLYPKEYREFCAKAFGKDLTYTPPAALAMNALETNTALRRVWWQSCKEEKIDAREPKALPLLFTLDAALNIPGGYRYAPSATHLAAGDSTGWHFGISFSSTCYDGGTCGLGDGDGSGGDGDGGGGGD